MWALGLLVGRVAVEGAGRGELAQLVADHVLRNEHWDKLATVVHGEGQANGFGENGAATAINNYRREQNL